MTAETQPPKQPYTQQRFIFMTLDPVHIGTGGYRLGRVDMSIMREPGTNLPKIPGTSLAGAARSYAHLSLFNEPESAKRDKALEPGTSTEDEKKKAEKKKQREAFYYTFGKATDAGGGQAGTVSIGDARILFFPVASQAGPVWITTAETLEEVWGKEVGSKEEQVALGTNQVITSFGITNGHLNLGWLFLEAKKVDFLPKIQPMELLAHWDAIKDRLVIVSSKLMTQIVNSNLEVRTSVSIDPQTGAADDGALFTYEALPRATWLWCDIIEDDYRGGFAKAVESLPPSQDKDKATPSRPLDVVRTGLDLIEYLGVGGMGTRGFGRMKVVSQFEPQKEQPGEEGAKVEEVAR